MRLVVLVALLAYEACAFSLLQHQRQQLSPFRSKAPELRANKQDSEPEIVSDLSARRREISFFSKEGKPREAEAALKEIIKEYQRTKDSYILPDRRLFCGVISAWAKNRDSRAAENAEALLEMMMKLSKETRKKNLVPDRIAFQCVLNAWAKRKDAMAASRAEAILRKMRELDKSGVADVKPDIASYNSVLSCIANSRCDDATDRAEAILALLIGPYNGGGEVAKPATIASGTVMPNRFTFYYVLRAWEKSGDPIISPSRAEAILRQMHNLDAAGFPDVIPDSYCYTSAISCVAKSEALDAADRAAAILKLMIDQYKAGDNSAAPDVVVFNIVINICAKSKAPDAGDIADAVFGQMKALGIRPDAKLISTIIAARSKNSFDGQAARKAEGYLKELIRLSDEGNADCELDVIMFTSVLKALATSNDPDAFIRARGLLDEMKRLEEKGNTNCRPDAIMYSFLLYVVAGSKAKDKAAVAWDILGEMDELGLKPIDSTYAAVLEACSNSRYFDRKSREQAFKVALRTIRLAHAENKLLPKSFGSFFTAAAGLGHNDEVEAVYEMCCEAGYEKTESVQRSLMDAERLESTEANSTSKSLMWSRAEEAKNSKYLIAEKLLRPSSDGSVANELDSSPAIWSSEEWGEAVDALIFWMKVRTAEGMEMSWRLMDRAIEQTASAGKDHIKWDGKLIRALVFAWSRTPGSNMTARDVMTKIWKYRSLAPSLYFDVSVYSIIIDTATKNCESDAHMLAEGILKALIDGANDKYLARPNTVIYNNAIYALARSGVADAPFRAESLVHQMRNLTAMGWENLQPDIVTYTLLVLTWSKTKKLPSSQRAEELLLESPDSNATSFNDVQESWEKSQEKAGDRCLQLYQQIKLLSESDIGVTIKPDTTLYGTVVLALANKGRATEAEAVLQEILDEGLVPEDYDFIAVMDAWARSGKKDAANRAEDLLELMNATATKLGSKKLLPNVTAFNSVLRAWTKSNDELLAASRADEIFNRMIDLDKAGVQNVKPDKNTYRAVIECLVKSRSDCASNRADEVLGVMIDQYEAGDAKARPDTYIFYKVIDAHAKSGDPGAYAKAQATFNRMKTLGVNPKKEIFNALIVAITRSYEPEAGIKAEEILEEMRRLSIGGFASCKPDATTYNSVIAAWSLSEPADEALTRARGLLYEMKRLDANGFTTCAPSVVTYYLLLRILARSQSKDKAKEAFDILSEIDERRMKPEEKTFSAVLLVCASSSAFDRPTRERAFEIALHTMQRAHAETKPTLQAFKSFFKSAAGLERGPDVEKVYEWCCEAGYENDGHIQSYMKSVLSGNKLQEPPEVLPQEKVQQPSDEEANTDVVTYDITISEVAKKGMASEADAALKSLLDRNIIPDRADFTSVLEAWAKSGVRDAAPRAEAILEMMNATATKAGMISLLPNVACFNSVLRAWAESKVPLAASEGQERVLRRMIELDKAGVPNVKPNEMSYGSVIDSLAYSLTRGSADRAEVVLGLMIDQYEAGDEKVQPRTDLFYKVINAHAKSGDPSASTKAQALFRRMKALGVYPSTETFTVLLVAMARSEDPQAGIKAEEILEEMKRLSNGGLARCKPDAKVFNAVIDAWSKSDPTEAQTRGRALLDEMKQLEASGTESCAPDVVTYTVMLESHCTKPIEGQGCQSL